MNKLDDGKIVFKEEEHEYWLGKNLLTSVTTWVSSFFQKFDEEKVSKKVADKRINHKDYETPEEYIEALRNEEINVLGEWQDSREHGTKVHKEVEDWINARALITEPKAMQAVSALLEHFPYYNNWYSEQVIYSKDLSLAGTIDFLMVEEDYYTKPRVTLVDWKTNKEIRRSNHWQQTSGVVSHLHDCHLVKYGLQLSTYAYILERDYGFLVDALYICHLTETGYELIPVDYLKETVKEMIKDGLEKD